MRQLNWGDMWQRRRACHVEGLTADTRIICWPAVGSRRGEGDRAFTPSVGMLVSVCRLWFMGWCTGAGLKPPQDSVKAEPEVSQYTYRSSIHKWQTLVTRVGSATNLKDKDKRRVTKPWVKGLGLCLGGFKPNVYCTGKRYMGLSRNRYIYCRHCHF